MSAKESLQYYADRVKSHQHDAIEAENEAKSYFNLALQQECDKETETMVWRMKVDRLRHLKQLIGVLEEEIKLMETTDEL